MTAHPARQNESAPFPAGGGETGGLIRTFGWSSTPLGPIASWPQSLKTATDMLLLSPVPIVLLWGADGTMIYNDAYSIFAGSRHPQLLGSKVREGWDEIADFNDNVMKVGLSGRTLAYENQELTLVRHGKPAPVWMNLNYSPVLDESGRPAGVIAIVVETTKQVLAQRRLRESEERFRALTNATSDVVYRMSPGLEGNAGARRAKFPAGYGHSQHRLAGSLPISGRHARHSGRHRRGDPLEECFPARAPGPAG